MEIHLLQEHFSCLQLCLHQFYTYSKQASEYTHCSKGLQTNSISTWARNHMSTHRSPPGPHRN